MEQEGIGDSVYLQRAREGLDRLSSILTNMSEASRLEESLQQTENQDFNLVALLEGCIQGYRLAYPEREIHLVCAQAKVQLHGAPDLVAQLLDKLINNAMEFAPEGTAISVTLEVRNQTAHIEVKNYGPELPDNMHGRLFDSMVSVRANKGANQQPHLGLGLYIARLITEFHKGHIEISNRDDTKGVVVRVAIPLS
jgi:signal transduction histidine kinase